MRIWNSMGIETIDQRGEAGANIIEYAIAASILIAVFILASNWLEQSGRDRTSHSTSAVEKTLPCGVGLSPDQCL